MVEEIKKLTATIASMANKFNNNPNPNPNGENINPNNGANAGSQGCQFKKSQNMGPTAAQMVFIKLESNTTA
jgi:hypothetical protein